MQGNLNLPESNLYNSINSIKEFMENSGLTMQKRFGQNFLLNESVRERIVGELPDGENLSVWEVGPGIGAITSVLVTKEINLTLFEIDRGFVKLLTNMYGDFSNLTVLEGDALKVWPIEFEKNGRPDLVIGNLPYNVGSVIIASFIEKSLLPSKMVFTVQKEVAMRMAEKPGSKSYSSFSMLCGLDYDVKKVFDISPGSFYPRPDVTSSVVSMTLKSDRMLEGGNLDDKTIRRCYFSLIRDLFRSRRKTVRNNLIKSGSLSSMDKEVAEKLCADCSIDLSDRGENLSIAQIWKLAKLLSKNS